MWVNYEGPQQNEIRILIQFKKDLQIVCYGVQHSRNSHIAELLWEREESLAHIDRVLFMKYEGYADNLNNDYHKKMDRDLLEGRTVQDMLSEVPANILLRIQTEVSDLFHYFISLKDRILGIGSDLQENSVSPSSFSTFNFESYIKA